jgi:hypothetical protein
VSAQVFRSDGGEEDEEVETERERTRENCCLLLVVNENSEEGTARSERNEHEIENFQENHLGNDEGECAFIAPSQRTDFLDCHKLINSCKFLLLLPRQRERELFSELFMTLRHYLVVHACILSAFSVDLCPLSFVDSRELP